MNRLRVGFVALVGLLVFATMARADGLPSYAPAATSRSVACYLGLYGQGSFVRTDTQIPAMGMDMTTGNELPGGGAQIGCDVPIGSTFLIGIVGDYTIQSAQLSNSLLGITANMPWGNEWSIRGRLGVWANQATLLYVHGGLAGLQDKSATIANVISMPFSGGTGLVVGAGLETRLSPGSGTSGWYLFGEYGHESFDTRNGTLLGVLATKADTVEDRVRAGLNYRF